MKRLSITLSIAIAAIAFAFTTSSNIEIGETSDAFNTEVYDFGMKGKKLADYNGQNGLLVVFSCNTCPFVVAWEDRYNELASLSNEAGVSMVLLNSNEAFRDAEDSPVNMRHHANDHNYAMPYLIDKDHQVADALGAKTTPHVFLFDKDLKLVYKGAIDDNHKDKDAVSETYLKDALTAMKSGSEVKVKETKALGCSIKRVAK
jgi:peroxiredoxin